MLGFLSGCSGGVSVDAAIQSVVQEYHWTPNIIDELFLDDIDHHGLYYWYLHLKDQHEEIKNKT